MGGPNTRRRHTRRARRMVDATYKGSACPYHRALYWLSRRWVRALLLTVVIVTIIIGLFVI
jgi:hypothetical protein